MKNKCIGIVVIAISFLVTLWLGNQEVLSQVTKPRALCVGINNFQNYLINPKVTLRGCINDANAMEALLIRWYGFSPGDIVKLTDAQATKENIIKQLKEMVDGARQGKYDYLVFSLSTHGTQVPDTNGDEPDGLDEAFCPYDLATTGDFWDPNHIIIDDELHALFAQLPRNVLLEVFLDTCCSGTGIRLAVLTQNTKPRLMPQPSEKAMRIVEERGKRKLDKRLLDRGAGTTNQILWAACRDHQESNDAEIPRGSGRFHGAFTYNFCKTMDETQKKLSRKEVIRKVREAVKSDFYPQEPQLEEYR